VSHILRSSHLVALSASGRDCSAHVTSDGVSDARLLAKAETSWIGSLPVPSNGAVAGTGEPQTTAEPNTSDRRAKSRLFATFDVAQRLEEQSSPASGPIPRRRTCFVGIAKHDPHEMLVSDALSGDDRAERSLLTMLRPTLLRVVRGVLGAHHPDVEDALQESMVRMHQALPSFRGDCLTLHFACRVAVHTAMNARRRAHHQARHTLAVGLEDLGEFPTKDPSPAEALASVRRRTALHGLLRELPVKQAEVLALHVLLGYSVKETAAVIRAPHDTVRSRLRAALAALRDHAGKHEVLLETSPAPKRACVECKPRRQIAGASVISRVES